MLTITINGLLVVPVMSIILAVDHVELGFTELPTLGNHISTLVFAAKIAYSRYR